MDWRKSNVRLGKVLLLGCGLFCACGKTGHHTEQEMRAYRLGQHHLRQGDRDAALRCFLLITQKNPGASAEAHLECAEIYLTDKKDPLAAIYHYREYLAHSPISRQSALVRQRIETAEKAFLTQIPLLRQMGHESQGDLLRTLKMQQDENAKLRHQLVLLNEKLAQLAGPSQEISGAVSPPAVARESATDGQERLPYVVVKGDTLSAISLKIHGTSARWREIFDANRDQLPSPTKLKPGQQLRIPR
jgi:hypothetical protein